MNLANNISIFRILLVPVFVSCLLYYDAARTYFYPVAIGIFVLACATDALDGYIARRFNQMTALGRTIDPIADKLLLVSGFLSLSLMENLPLETHIPAWVTISVIARDIIILIGSLVVFVTTGSLKPKPLLIGKFTTFFQMLTLFLSLITAPAALRMASFVLTTALTLASGIQYIRVGGRVFQEKS